MGEPCSLCSHGQQSGLKSCQVKAGEAFEGEMQRFREGWGRAEDAQLRLAPLGFGGDHNKVWSWAQASCRERRMLEVSS